MLWRNDQPRWYSPGFIAPCLPTAAKRPPSGPFWVYEIKHDGYRLIVRKAGERVRIFTRRGADWSHRFPRIVEAVERLRASSIMLDGERVICGEDGMANFDALHSKQRDADVFLYAFDLLELDGQDRRQERLDDRKSKLDALLRRSRVDSGIQLNEHTDHDGARVFEEVCRMGLEGIVAKRIDLPYRSGRSRAWIKVRNPKAPAVTRIEDGTF
jgi:bifunctional non-homologous end joining protein LigD